MPTPDVAELTDLVLDRLQANVADDPAFSSDQILRHLNEAYADVWEMSGGAMKRVTGEELWDPQPSITPNGIFTSLVADIGEIKELFYSTIPSSTGDRTEGDTTLTPADLSEVLYMREVQGFFGAYARPKLYAVTPNFSDDPAEVNKVQLDVWPGVIGGYLPTHYVPQFTPLSDTVTRPALNDLLARDLALLAAARMGPLTGRAELVPSILMDISSRTAAAMERKLSSMMSAKADR